MKNNILKNKKSGFSLIELAMVLVIIGLLIAGIMGGSSLIQNAKLRSIISESRSYQTAVNSFYAKYDAVPGDYAQAVTDASGVATTIFGNGNGVIETTVSNIGAVATGDENAVAWVQLEASAITPRLVSVTPPSANTEVVLTAGSNNKVRSSTNGGAIVLDSITENGRSSNALILTARPDGMGGGGGTRHFYDQNERLVGVTADWHILRPILKTEDARNLDIKIDDGSANTGNVIGLNAPTRLEVFQSAAIPGTVCQQITTVAPDVASSNPNYNIAYSELPACGMAFIINL